MWNASCWSLVSSLEQANMSTVSKIVELGWKVWDDAAEIMVFMKSGPITNVKDRGRVWLRVRTRMGETIVKVSGSNLAELEGRVRELLSESKKR
jgi:hypothetical protein